MINSQEDVATYLDLRTKFEENFIPTAQGWTIHIRPTQAFANDAKSADTVYTFCDTIRDAFIRVMEAHEHELSSIPERRSSVIYGGGTTFKLEKDAELIRKYFIQEEVEDLQAVGEQLAYEGQLEKVEALQKRMSLYTCCA